MTESYTEPKCKPAIDAARLAAAMDQLPVGITIIDPAGIMLYYNAHSARYVDRRPEYIGRDIRDCHMEDASIKKIEGFLKLLAAGSKEEVRYEAERGGVRLAVTVAPFEFEGELIGFIQSFIVQES